MESPYVLYARARGESEMQIVVRHGLRNVLLPAITLQFAPSARFSEVLCWWSRCFPIRGWARPP